EGRLALLRVAKHIHDEVIDLPLVLLDDAPALLEHRVILLAQAHLQDFAARAQALEDVLDVVRQRRDGLADGREPFRLKHGLVVARFLYRQGRLMADGDGQGEVVTRELDRRTGSAEGRVARAAARVKVDHAERLVPALHRHADRLADTEANDTLPGAETLILGG